VGIKRKHGEAVAISDICFAVDQKRAGGQRRNGGDVFLNLAADDPRSSKERRAKTTARLKLLPVPVGNPIE